MAVVTMKQLLEAGVHFGHQTRRWNPKMKRFIFGERNGIYIIDLQQTLTRIETAYTFVRDLVADGGTVLFIGTKKQAQDPIQSYAEKSACRTSTSAGWAACSPTSRPSPSASPRCRSTAACATPASSRPCPRRKPSSSAASSRSSSATSAASRQMERLPDAVFILDTKKEHIGVTEANKLGIPIVAVVDTNCDPDVIQYVIPGNDDAIRSGNLMCRVIADAVEEGRFIASRARHRRRRRRPQRTEDEEARVAAEQAEARRQALLAQQEREARLAAAPDPAAAADPVAEAPAAEAEPRRAPRPPPPRRPSPSPRPRRRGRARSRGSRRRAEAAAEADAPAEA